MWFAWLVVACSSVHATGVWSGDCTTDGLPEVTATYTSTLDLLEQDEEISGTWDFTAEVADYTVLGSAAVSGARNLDLIDLMVTEGSTSGGNPLPGAFHFQLVQDGDRATGSLDVSSGDTNGSGEVAGYTTACTLVRAETSSESTSGR